MLTKLFLALIALILGSIMKGLARILHAITFNPADEQPEGVVCIAPEPIPMLQPGQRLKLLTYNVQFMAGKNYVFFYDLPDWSGPHKRPSAQDIGRTIAEVARIIQAEDPDLILLQEVDHGASRTDYEDQLARLLPLLGHDYRCHVSAFYWQAGFVPHPKIMGSVGQKLSIISKYKISQAIRHQLPTASTDPVVQIFSPKRAILEARLPIAGGPALALLTTHLEVANQNSAFKAAEMCRLYHRLEWLDQSGIPWVLGGDFNLRPPRQFGSGPGRSVQPETALKLLFDRYQALPRLTDLQGAQAEAWFTMFPNAPASSGPDRTVDYFFCADNLNLAHGFVRQHDTRHISDHLPLLAEIILP